MKGSGGCSGDSPRGGGAAQAAGRGRVHEAQHRRASHQAGMAEEERGGGGSATM